MKNIILLIFSIFMLSACMVQKQNIQLGNTTGKIVDNKWDYYNNTPIHYTSSGRSIYKNGLNVLNENTDAFTATFNLDKSSAIGSVVFNNNTYILKSTSANYFKQVSGWAQKDVNVWDRYYLTQDEKIFIAVQHRQQFIALSSYQENGDRLSIGYYPSRFLACRKIATLQNTQNIAMFNSLLKTALVAGVQSYTNYSTYNGQGTIAGKYNNYGYTQTGTYRDYSWAGDRASDALSTIFSGNASMANLNNAWQNLNCW